MMTVTPATLEIEDTPRVPFGRLIAVELRKIRDTRAGFWLILTTLGLGVLADVIALIVVIVQNGDITFGDFTGVFAFVSSIFLPILGIMLVTSEWSQRTGMVTFTLEPHRGKVIGAKLLAGLSLTVVAIVIAVISGFICNGILDLVKGGADWTFGWRGMGAFAVNQTLAMLGGFALACLFLNTAAAIVAFFVYTYVLPGLIALGSNLFSWFKDVAPWIDFQQAKGQLYDGPLPHNYWWEFLVSGIVWLVVPVAIGLWRIFRAEVK